jgi:quercetin dioxygenase-like cupin family protein
MTDQWAFNVDDMAQGIPRVLCEGITTRIFPGDHAMLSVVRIEPNSQGTLHSHPEEQWGYLLEGELIRVQGGKETLMKVGDFWRSPPNVEHTVRTGDTGAVVLDVFSPPREEYKQAGSGFGDETDAD